MSVYPGDLNNDGRLDVVGVAQSASKIIWFENNGENSYQEHVIDEDFRGSMCQIVDFNKDGQMDVIACGGGAISQVILWIFH